METALAALLQDRPYAAITIEELIDRADVVRATFYAHYPDKDALLLAVVQGLMGELTTRVEPIATLPTGSYDGRALLEIVLHALEHPGLYRAVLSGAGGAAPRHCLVDVLSAAVERTFARTAEALGGTPRVPLAFAARSLVAQVLAVIEELLTTVQPPPNPTLSLATTVQVTATMTALAARGLSWGLGLESLADQTQLLAEYARSRTPAQPADPASGSLGRDVR